MNNSHLPLSFSHLPKIKTAHNLNKSKTDSTKHLLGQLLREAHGETKSPAFKSNGSVGHRSALDCCPEKKTVNRIEFAGESTKTMGDAEQDSQDSPVSKPARNKASRKAADYLRQIQSVSNVRFQPDFVKKKGTEESRPQFELSDCEILVAGKQELKTVEVLRRENAMLQEKVAYYKKSRP